MNTYFASPEIAEPVIFTGQLESISTDPIFPVLLTHINNIVMILNDCRQVLAINSHFCNYLGIESPQTMLGLRPGSIFNCENATLEEGGCGTSKFCASCGLAIAVVACQSERTPIERFCSIDCNNGNISSDLYLKIQASQIATKDEKFTLVLAHDMTKQQYWSNMERFFFHDIRNLMQGILNRCNLLKKSQPERSQQLAEEILQIGQSLNSEFAIQRLLQKNHYDSYQTTLQQIDINRLLNEIELDFNNDSCSFGKQIKINNFAPEAKLISDYSLLHRVIGHMLNNALEASQSGDKVKLEVSFENKKITFSVWNRQIISDKNRLRIFQRNFSTKNNLGHGLGCFLMKLFGEKCLHGEVGFSSNHEDGTHFWIHLPAASPLPS